VPARSRNEGAHSTSASTPSSCAKHILQRGEEHARAVAFCDATSDVGDPNTVILLSLNLNHSRLYSHVFRLRFVVGLSNRSLLLKREYTILTCDVSLRALRRTQDVLVVPIIGIAVETFGIYLPRSTQKLEQNGGMCTKLHKVPGSSSVSVIDDQVSGAT
jgi:hypothetical protein